MDTRQIPDFFQDENEPALLLRARWLDENLGLDCTFLAAVLRVEKGLMDQWQAGTHSLPAPAADTLCSLWTVVLRLLSRWNYDEAKFRDILMEGNGGAIFAAAVPPHGLWPVTKALMALNPFLGLILDGVLGGFAKNRLTMSRSTPPMTPPWYPRSLKAFLEYGGIDAIHDVNDWIMALRFGDPYSAPPRYRVEAAQLDFKALTQPSLTDSLSHKLIPQK